MGMRNSGDGIVMVVVGEIGMGGEMKVGESCLNWDWMSRVDMKIMVFLVRGFCDVSG